MTFIYKIIFLSIYEQCVHYLGIKLFNTFPYNIKIYRQDIKSFKHLYNIISPTTTLYRNLPQLIIYIKCTCMFNYIMLLHYFDKL